MNEIFWKPNILDFSNFLSVPTDKRVTTLAIDEKCNYFATYDVRHSLRIYETKNNEIVVLKEFEEIGNVSKLKIINESVVVYKTDEFEIIKISDFSKESRNTEISFNAEKTENVFEFPNTLEEEKVI